MVRHALFTASLLGNAVLAAATPCTKRASNSSLVASSYFAGYHADDGFPVSSIPWEKYNNVIYAFAETTSNGSLDLSASNPDLIPSFVSAAKSNNVKALVSVGGWTGSRFFSTSFGSEENRTAFAQVCMDLVNQYGLDGLDFDYEYPNRQGLGCNAINESDTANYLSFLQKLRSMDGGANLTLTAAGSLFPWYNSSGVASTGGALSGFADVLDYVMVMNYDIYGAWASTGGPNAPLASSCDTRNNQGSAESGIAAWIAAGLTADKIVLGVPGYGHAFSVSSTAAFNNDSTLNMFPTQNSSNRFQGSSWDNDPAVDVCGNAQPHSGTYPFWSLITEAGFLDETGEPAQGIFSGFDDCSQTPALYNQTSERWVSYDNAKSLAAKGKFVVDNGLKGFAMFETGGDYNNILIDSIRQAVGLS